MIAPSNTTRPPQTVWRLDGKVAVITGGSHGIGKASALELSALGAKVFLIARNAQALKETVEQIGQLGGNSEAITADVTDSRDREAILTSLSSTEAIHCLINNVGGGGGASILQQTESDFQKTIQANLISSVELAKMLFAKLKMGATRSQDSSSIVNVSSIVSQVALHDRLAYSASKAALDEASRCMAIEWASEGIRVNTVLPWYTRTRSTSDHLQRPEIATLVKGRTPMGRPADANEVARAIAFLCLPAASYITGASLPVDGGFLASGGYAEG